MTGFNPSINSLILRIQKLAVLASNPNRRARSSAATWASSARRARISSFVTYRANCSTESAVAVIDASSGNLARPRFRHFRQVTSDGLLVADMIGPRCLALRSTPHAVFDPSTRRCRITVKPFTDSPPPRAPPNRIAASLALPISRGGCLRVLRLVP